MFIQLDSNQWNLVYNVFSLGLISMLATTVYTLVSQPRVLAKYRTALVMSSMVTFIAGYHYLRIFDSFKHASEGGSFTFTHHATCSSISCNDRTWIPR
jgi:hypothetical protein